MALRKSLSTAGRAVSDAQMKDILKNARNGLSDKALPIQRAAADVRIIFIYSTAFADDAYLRDRS